MNQEVQLILDRWGFIKPQTLALRAEVSPRAVDDLIQLGLFDPFLVKIDGALFLLPEALNHLQEIKATQKMEPYITPRAKHQRHQRWKRRWRRVRRYMEIMFVPAFIISAFLVVGFLLR
ncbi:MAG: hypothetical protein D6675_05500 [Gemmatimonadetes bacterium]|nr:MAG: hypothetical protein D6675_05500 [Gemmatimonadota bacterium]